MKDPELPIRAGYYALLNGIVVDGRAISVYDMQAPEKAVAPYIILGGILSFANNTKDGFGGEVQVNIMALSEFKGDFGGREITDKIVNRILELSIPTPGKAGITATGFNVYSAKKLRTNDEFDYPVTGRKYRKRVTIEHLVQEI